jgi:hypothetical protein
MANVPAAAPVGPHSQRQWIINHSGVWLAVHYLLDHERAHPGSAHSPPRPAPHPAAAPASTPTAPRPHSCSALAPPIRLEITARSAERSGCARRSRTARDDNSKKLFRTGACSTFCVPLDPRGEGGNTRAAASADTLVGDQSGAYRVPGVQAEDHLPPGRLTGRRVRCGEVASVAGGQCRRCGSPAAHAPGGAFLVRAAVTAGHCCRRANCRGRHKPPPEKPASAEQ